MLGLSTSILVNWLQGTPASGAVTIAKFLGGSIKLALWISLALAALGFSFGFRALIWNKVCLGNNCPTHIQSTTLADKRQEKQSESDFG